MMSARRRIDRTQRYRSSPSRRGWAGPAVLAPAFAWACALSSPARAQCNPEDDRQYLAVRDAFRQLQRAPTQGVPIVERVEWLQQAFDVHRRCPARSTLWLIGSWAATLALDPVQPDAGYARDALDAFWRAGSSIHPTHQSALLEKAAPELGPAPVAIEDVQRQVRAKRGRLSHLGISFEPPGAAPSPGKGWSFELLVDGAPAFVEPDPLSTLDQFPEPRPAYTLSLLAHRKHRLEVRMPGMEQVSCQMVRSDPTSATDARACELELAPGYQQVTVRMRPRVSAPSRPPPCCPACVCHKSLWLPWTLVGIMAAASTASVIWLLEEAERLDDKVSAYNALPMSAADARSRGELAVDEATARRDAAGWVAFTASALFAGSVGYAIYETLTRTSTQAERCPTTARIGPRVDLAGSFGVTVHGSF
jgi:hypothetical protein